MTFPSASHGRGYTSVYKLDFLKDKSVVVGITALIVNIAQAFIDATNASKKLAFYSPTSLYLAGNCR